MKYLLLGTALVAGGLGAAWYGGETWLSGKAREAIANSPAVEAASVAPLRDPRRIGLHLAEVEVGDDRNGFSAPGLDVYAPLTAPTRFSSSVRSMPQMRAGMKNRPRLACQNG